MKPLTIVLRANKIKKNTNVVVLNVALGLLSLVLLVFSLTVDPILIFIKYLVEKDRSINSWEEVDSYSNKDTADYVEMSKDTAEEIENLKFDMVQYTRVTDGSVMHGLLKKEIQSLLLSTYLFNITNPEKFLSGEDHNLKVQEVGPFTYREIRRHEDIEIDEAAQVLRYTPRIRLVFQPEESVAFPEDLNLTMPNLPMLGLASKMSQYSLLARLPLNILLTNLQSTPVVNVNAKRYLWGYKEPLVTLANTLMPGFISFDKMGILSQIHDPRNINRLELSVANQDKFKIRKINGYKKLRMSESENPDSCAKCDTFDSAYEGIGFPPGLPPDLRVRIFKSGLCRLLPVEYNSTRRMDFGGDAFVYHFSDSFFSSTPNVTADGLVDFSDCVFGLPIAVSKAHLMGVNPELYSRVEGMKPNEQQSGWAIIEPKLGIALETQASIQMNLVMKDVSYNTQAKSFSNMVVPIGYLKIVQANLPEEMKGNLWLTHTVGPYLVLSMQILLFFIIIASGGYLIKHFVMSKNVLVPKPMQYGISFPQVVIGKHTNDAFVEEPLLEMPEIDKS